MKSDEVSTHLRHIASRIAAGLDGTNPMGKLISNHYQSVCELITDLSTAVKELHAETAAELDNGSTVLPGIAAALDNIVEEFGPLEQEEM
jgi:hypothetical protein